MTDAHFLERVALLKRLGFLAIGGIVLLLLTLRPMQQASEQVIGVAILVGVLAIAPAFVYLTLLTIWHWKGRYRGSHSDLWGGLLLIETSGWFKLVYLFRHIIPDARGTGRYARTSIERVA